MLAVERVSIQFAGRTLFRDLSFTLGPRDRVALAGPNGTGKTTLLRVIAGECSPDAGQVKRARYITVGYLPQDGVRASGRTLYAEAESAFEDAVRLREELEAASERLGQIDHADPEYAEALEVYAELQLRLEHHDIGGMRARVERVLSGLGFGPEDFGRATETFSGGWQMRIALAKLLLCEPAVLLLDEPTNHLDIDSQLWLEGYLRDYNGALVLISHDRAFLDTLSRRTFAFHAGRVEEYAGNYSYFVAECGSRREQLERAYKNQQRELRHAEEFINRFRAKARRASQVQSRLRQIEKIERIELVPEDDAEIRFRFPPAPRGGMLALELEGVEKVYPGGRAVLSGLDFSLERGDRLAVLGVNGAGKSTFARLLAGVEPMTAGRRKLGHNAIVSYFAQDHADSLDPRKTVLQTVQEVVPAGADLNLRTLLGCFLFRGDDVFKSVSVLSGGERSRLALARMLLVPSNCLILDEPTNHLDMRSQEVLQRALSEYEGSTVIVSHNRAFLDPITTRVIEFRPEARPPILYPGNVSEYLEYRERRGETSAAATVAPGARRGVGATTGVVKARVEAPGTLTRKEQRRVDAERRRERGEVLRPLRRSLVEVEEQIGAIERRRAEIERSMTDPAVCGDAAQLKDLSLEYRESAPRLERLFSDWARMSEEIERAERELG